jgi:dihydroneopterin aldolase
MALSRISLKDIALVGHHGYHAAERELGQRFIVDVDLFADLTLPGRTDKLSDAIDYEKVYHLVEKIVREDHFFLVEALATDLVTRIRHQFNVAGVRVKVRKPSVPFCPDLGHVEVEVCAGEVPPAGPAIA